MWWMWWMISFDSWHPIYLQWLMVIVWDGSWRRTGILISVCFIISYMVLPSLFFHGKVFRRLRHPGVSLSLFGQSHGIKCSREITCRLGALISLTSALCVIVVERQWIICYYTIERLIGCGALSLKLLGFRGFPHVRWQIFYLVGGTSGGSIQLAFGI